MGNFSWRYWFSVDQLLLGAETQDRKKEKNFVKSMSLRIYYFLGGLNKLIQFTPKEIKGDFVKNG